MNRESKILATDRIRQLVWGGFFDRAEIAQIIDETVLEPGEADPAWVSGLIDRTFREKEIEESLWPQVTNCDRLDQVFDRLNRENILALQNAGYSQSDGLDDVSQLYHEAGGTDSDIEGYCFFHGQDLERVLQSGEMYLTFGDILGEDAKGIEIGRRIERALAEAGFRIEWDGSIKTRLLVKGIQWQRRRKPQS